LTPLRDLRCSPSDSGWRLDKPFGVQQALQDFDLGRRKSTLGQVEQEPRQRFK
jgi:hypothetical protein